MALVKQTRFYFCILVLSAVLQCAVSSPIPHESQKDQVPDPPTAVPLDDQNDPKRLAKYAELGLKDTPVQKSQPYSSLHPDARGYPPAYLLPSNGQQKNTPNTTGSKEDMPSDTSPGEAPLNGETPAELPMNASPGQSGALHPTQGRDGNAAKIGNMNLAVAQGIATGSTSGISSMQSVGSGVPAGAHVAPAGGPVPPAEGIATQPDAEVSMKQDVSPPGGTMPPASNGQALLPGAESNPQLATMGSWQGAPGNGMARQKGAAAAPLSAVGAPVGVTVV